MSRDVDLRAAKYRFKGRLFSGPPSLETGKDEFRRSLIQFNNDYKARSESGTRCSRAPFMRSGGTVQTLV